MHILFGQAAGDTGSHPMSEGQDQVGIQGTPVLEPAIWLKAQRILEVLGQAAGNHILSHHGGLSRS